MTFSYFMNIKNKNKILNWVPIRKKVNLEKWVYCEWKYHVSSVSRPIFEGEEVI